MQRLLLIEHPTYRHTKFFISPNVEKLFYGKNKQVNILYVESKLEKVVVGDEWKMKMTYFFCYLEEAMTYYDRDRFAQLTLG